MMHGEKKQILIVNLKLAAREAKLDAKFPSKKV